MVFTDKGGLTSPFLQQKNTWLRNTARSTAGQFPCVPALSEILSEG